MADAISHGFDQHWSVVLNTILPCSLGGIVDSEDVIAVDPDGGHAVAGAPGRDSVASVLFLGRSGDRITIVPTKEDDGAFECGCEVEGSMGIPFRGSSVAEIADHSQAVSLPLVGISGSNSLGHLGGQRRRDRDKVQCL